MSNSDSHTLMNMPLPPASAWKYRVEGAQKMTFGLDDANEYPPVVLFLYVEGSPAPVCEHQPQFRKHLGNHIETFRTVDLSAEYRAALLAAARPHRPAMRDANYAAQPQGSLQLDALRCFGPATMVVELKPKCAVQSRSRLVSPDFARVLGKYTTPIYHIKEYKAKGSTPDQLYYPADLLSCDYDRVRRASSLLVEENSRGIRVFECDGTNREGKAISKSKSAYKALIVGVHGMTKYTALCEGIVKIQAADVVDILGAEALMKELQKRVGQEGAEILVRKFIRRKGDVVDEDVAESLATWTKAITYESSEVGEASHTVESYEQAVGQIPEIPSEIIARLVADYLEAAVAKDCSVLISVAPETNMSPAEIARSEHSVTVDGAVWHCKAVVIDIGEKGIERVTGRWPNVERSQYKKVLFYQNDGK